jgi:HK97 gp10 family phage protein
MAQAFDISLLGDRELQQQFRALPLAVQRKLLRQSFRAALRPVLTAARAAAPRLTGRLARTLRLRALRRRRGQLGMMVISGTRESLNIPADHPWYYPAHVELGTSKMPAQPYLRPAFDTQREHMLQTLARGIEEAMRSV